MILDTLGWILHLRGEHDEALETLLEADRNLPGHPVVLYHLAAVHVALGDADAARPLLERALASTIHFHERDAAAALLADFD